MSDYGGSGASMQKTVVLGGASHTVFYNQNGSVSSGALQTAINNALNATGIIENSYVNMGLRVFPNPVINNAKINYTLNNAVGVGIDVLNLLGEKVNSFSLGIQSAGKQEYQLNLESLSAGVYFVKLIAGEASETAKMTVVK